ncbi:MAG: DUF6080 domain-containing protein [Prevotella sp.]
MKIFKIKREERWLVVVALLLFVTLNLLLILSQWAAYTKGAPGGFWSIFNNKFCMSGYDYWSWLTVSDLKIHYATNRHPLYLTILYPLYLLNHWLMAQTGINFAVFFVGAILVFSACYAVVFSYRIFREVLALSHRQSLVLVLLLFSFGHVMIPAMVPDHFIISMMLLTMTVYICGKRMHDGRYLQWWQSMLLLFFTSGVATSNGIKSVMASLFVNGKKMFQRRFLLLGILLPMVVLLGIQQCQYNLFEQPQAKELQKIEAVKAKKVTAKKKQQAAERRAWMSQHDMQHAGKSGVLKLMDFSTPRIPTVIENFWGESILLHKDYALQDVLYTRPVIVHYRSWGPYVLLGLLFVCFVLGIWTGRKQRVMQMLLIWFSVDVMIHLVLGFAVNEVYIMASGWVFIIPVAIGYLLKSMPPTMARYAEGILALVALSMMTYHGWLIIDHLYL